MIPSVQLVSNSGTLSNIHNELLDKFEMPITSGASQIEHTTAQMARFNGHFDSNNIIMHHDDVLIRTMKADNFGEIVLDCVDDQMLSDMDEMDNAHTICIDNENLMNYTIIGNGLILNVIDESEVDFDDGTDDSSNANERIADDLADVPHMTIINEENAVDDEVDECAVAVANIVQQCDPHSTEYNSSIAENDDDNSNRKALVTATDTNNSSAPDVTETQAHKQHYARSSIEDAMDDENDDDSDDSSSEHELTNLGWLIDLKNLAHFPSDAHSSKRDSSAKNAHALATNTISTCIIDDIDDDNGRIEPMISDKDLSEERFKKFTIQVKQSQKTYAEREKIYRMNPLEKPPFNYAQIIAMAMMDQGRMTLKDICKWIQEHFAYFRCNKNWNNSIRHNLSLHFCFTKIARDKTEKGKGGYWELSMNATKSEKKRIRNRRKQRDSGRFSLSQRTGNSSKRSGQKSSISRSTPMAPKTVDSSLPFKSKVTSDSCNASITSDASSSVCSSSITDEAASMWTDMNGTQSAQQLLATAQHSIANDHLIGQVIGNDMVIVNGVLLDQNSSDTVEYNFERSQIVDSFFIESHQSASRLLRHQSSCSDSPINTTITSPMLNDSSNEIFIKSDLNDQPSLIDATSASVSTAAITTATTTTTSIAANSSNVIVEPMPYCLSHMDTVIDIEHEFSSLVNLPDPELAEDGFFDYNTW